MMEHIKYVVTGAVALMFVVASLAGVVWVATEHFFVFLSVVMAYPTYWLGQKLVSDYRDTVKLYGKDWWKN
jgi:hypothetical protein